MLSGSNQLQVWVISAAEVDKRSRNMQQEEEDLEEGECRRK